MRAFALYLVGLVHGWIKSLIAHNQSDIDKALAPFAKARNSIAVVEAKARAQEQKLRAQAASILMQADAVAREVQKAAAAQSKLDNLLSK